MKFCYWEFVVTSWLCCLSNSSTTYCALQYYWCCYASQKWKNHSQHRTLVFLCLGNFSDKRGHQWTLHIKNFSYKCYNAKSVKWHTEQPEWHWWVWQLLSHVSGQCSVVPGVLQHYVVFATRSSERWPPIPVHSRWSKEWKKQPSKQIGRQRTSPSPSTARGRHRSMTY